MPSLQLKKIIADVSLTLPAPEFGNTQQQDGKVIIKRTEGDGRRTVVTTSDLQNLEYTFVFLKRSEFQTFKSFVKGTGGLEYELTDHHAKTFEGYILLENLLSSAIAIDDVTEIQLRFKGAPTN